MRSNRWKLPEKLVEGIAALDVVEQRPNRDPGANELGRSARSLRVAVFDWGFVGHGYLQPFVEYRRPWLWPVVSLPSICGVTAYPTRGRGPLTRREFVSR
jgi:hypothetical protein